MKQIRVQAVVDNTKCSGCETCVHVCPTMAYTQPTTRPTEPSMSAPCHRECPVGNDIEGFLYLVQHGKWDDALNILRTTNPLPGVTGRVCDSPCEQVCNRTAIDTSVSIRAIERAIADYSAERPMETHRVQPKYKERVAVIGSGPAGLSCAYHLTQRGFRITLYEQYKHIGGVLRYGIPGYRFPKDVLNREVGWLLQMGIEAKVGYKWGDNLKMKDLDGFDAIFLALGFQRCRVLGIPGEDSPQVLSGMDFLAQVHSNQIPELGPSVVIVGGGNSAVDSARTALRLGAKPIVVYRRREEDMPAIRSEIHELKEEGIEILFQTNPTRYLLENGRMVAVECIKMAPGEPQADGRRLPVPVPRSGFTIPAESVIQCLGETGDLDGAPLELQCEGERIDADPWGRTSIEKLFAGGDIATGRGTVAHALGSGRRGARAIAAYLLAEPIPDREAEITTVSAAMMNLDYFDPLPQLIQPRKSGIQAVSGFDEIFQTAPREACHLEAQRCLHCGIHPEFNVDHCRGCSNCSSRCPTMAISLREIEKPYTVKTEIDEALNDQVREICIRANIHPESIVCFCTSTRAMEIAAAILKGAHSPEEISRKTGARTGCGVLCIEPIFRLMISAGLDLGLSPVKDLWYPTVPTLWEIPAKVIERYEGRGFRFAEDMTYYEKVVGDEKACNRDQTKNRS